MYLISIFSINSMESIIILIVSPSFSLLQCEREFREYIRDKTIEAKTSFRELLQECKLISHKSMEQIRENPAHLREIEEILRNDKRYLDLEHVDEERTQIIVHYLEELQKRGPPPPPTAATSARRKP